LAAQLSEADRAIGRLAGEGRRFANPHQFIRSFVRREAVLSSRIEGTQATLGELFAAEAGAVVERSPADLREVGNYVTAMEYGVRRMKQLPPSLRLVRELHERLMRGVRGDTATPGEFRRSQNWMVRRGARPQPRPTSTSARPAHGLPRSVGAIPARRIATARPRRSSIRSSRPSIRSWTGTVASAG
jgi:Fic family protein